jgi:hypothetical protein
MHIGWYVPNEHTPDLKRRRLVMKRLLTLGAATIAVLLLIVMPVASQAPQAERTFSGTLGKVDAEKKMITVKGPADQPEMTFKYDDKTQVTGAEKTVQGLTGKTGAMLKVTYREQGADRIATRIDVSEAKK